MGSGLGILSVFVGGTASLATGSVGCAVVAELDVVVFMGFFSASLASHVLRLAGSSAHGNGLAFPPSSHSVDDCSATGRLI